MYTHLKTIVIVSILLLTSLIGKAQVIDSIISKTAHTITSAAGSVKDGVVNSYNYADTSSTFKTVYNDGKEALKALASLLRTSVERVFYVMVKQQYMLGFIDLGKFLLMLTLLIWISKKVTKTKTEDPNSLAYDGFRIIHLVFLIFFVYSTLNVYIPSISQHFINPEYPVYLQIIDMIKQIRK